MTIKEAEKVTHLTMKSIRYYEEKGLIKLKRNQENDYRKFSKEDIEKLKLIKILRYLNFSIEDIKNVFVNNDLSNALKEKLIELENTSNNHLEKKDICNSLLKTCKKKEFDKTIDNYSETIDFLESDEGENFKKTIIEVLCPNISAVIIQSLILIAPIIWLFVNIKRQMWDALIFNSIVAIICNTLLIIEWLSYLNYRKKHKKQVKEKNNKNSLIIPIMVIAAILVIALFILLNVLMEYLIAPENYLFFELSTISSFLMIFIIVIILFMLIGFTFKKLKINKIESLDIYIEFWKHGKFIVIILFTIITYCFATNITFVLEDKIIYRNPFHPLGITYNYNDITKIETGFGNKIFSIYDYKRKGEFYYRIYMGKRNITFHVPSTNSKIEKYENDSYLELEEFDQKLMKLNIQKQVDAKNAKNCNLDKIYCDRFIRIINNR